MLSPREQQNCWSRFKAPAAVSLACLAATLLIAAQGFKGHPITKHSNLPTQQSSSTSIGVTGSELETAGLVQPARIKQGLEEQIEGRVGSTDTQRELPDSNVGEESRESNKQKASGAIETATQEMQSFPQWNETASLNTANATAYREEFQGTELLIVNKTSSARAPHGILLLFHGCSHGGLDWWYPSPTCPNCTGLPEEVSVTKAALKRDFFVVAFSSSDREVHRCWDVSYNRDPESSKDMMAVMNAWQELAERQGWGRLPLYALGGSSGGAFLLQLALRMPMTGIIPVIMGVPAETLENKPHALDQSKSWPYPPTFFIHMARDEMTAEYVAEDIAVLKKQGVPVTEVVVSPKNISANFFSDRIEGIDNSTSAEMYRALLAEGCINSTGYLVDNPRSLSMMRKWQKALRENVSSSKTMNFIKDESPVFEELNVAWAGHELVSDHMDNALDWFATKVDGPKLMSAVNPRL